jgi:hypothetical protein
LHVLWFDLIYAGILYYLVGLIKLNWEVCYFPLSIFIVYFGLDCVFVTVVLNLLAVSNFISLLFYCVKYRLVCYLFDNESTKLGF